MRRLGCFVAILFLGKALPVWSQILTPQTVTSAGGFVVQGNNSLSFTIGQPVGTVLSTGAGSVSQGFQQAAAVRIVTATEPVLNELVRVFPNPARQYLSIDCPPASLTLTDMLGRPCWQGRSDGKPIQVNVQSFAAGIYLLQFQTKNAIQTIRLLFQP